MWEHVDFTNFFSLKFVNLDWGTSYFLFSKALFSGSGGNLVSRVDRNILVICLKLFIMRLTTFSSHRIESGDQ